MSNFLTKSCFSASLLGRLIGVSLVLVGGGCNRVLNTFPSCSYICFLVSSLFSSSQSFRFYSFFSPLCCSLLIATSLSSLLHSGEQQCVSIVCMCLLLYSESYSLLFSSLPRYHRSYTQLSYNPLAFHLHSSLLPPRRDN